jgi:hypothetical protein
MVCIQKEVDLLHETIKNNHMDLLNLYTPEIDDLVKLSKIEQELISRGIIVQ